MSEPVLWFTFMGPGDKEWKVFLSNQSHNPLLGDGGKEGGASGVAYYDAGIIEIDCADHDAEWQDSTVLHEIIHTALEGANLSPRKEERIVLRLEKALWPVLRSFGLKWPKRPGAYRRIKEGR